MMNRIPGILFHTLKGSKGWSTCDIVKVDVARITKMEYDRRLFCLLDMDKPFTLQLTYYLPQVESRVAPVWNFGHSMGAAFVNETTLERLITKRYGSEDEVKQEILEIERKMEKVDRVCRKLAAAGDNRLINDERHEEQESTHWCVGGGAHQAVADGNSRRPPTKAEIDHVFSGIQAAEIDIDKDVDRALLILDVTAKWRQDLHRPHSSPLPHSNSTPNDDESNK